MSGLVHRCGAVFVVGLGVMVGIALGPQRLAAQEPGVRIGLTYTPGSQPGIYLLPVRGVDGDSIRRIIGRDLAFGHRLTVISPDSGAVPPAGRLNYPLYARLGAAGVVQVVLQADGSAQVTLHDVVAAQAQESRRFTLPGPPFSPAWRLAVHGIADAVEEWVTGTRGIAASRVLFVRGGVLWQIDSDGANEQPVPGVGAALGPAWHPDGRSIAFARMREDGTSVVVRELASGAERRVPTSAPLSLSPAFSPDGRWLAFAAGESGTDLYLAPLGAWEEPPLRVTVGRGSTNAQPTFAPDGRRLAFTTSRLGRHEIYLTDADGANPELLTSTVMTEAPYRADPAWSPDGRFVAFSTQIDGRFQIATITLRDRTVRQYTTEGINEDPAWAPDGRHLVFTSSRTGTRQLWVLDTESGRVRQLTRGVAARMGAWSPRLLGTP
ncbi:MAG: hypothetical protein ACO32Z_05395 [Gemmatimonadaceae bacterium]|jgi:TolB protein